MAPKDGLQRFRHQEPDEKVLITTVGARVLKPTRGQKKLEKPLSPAPTMPHLNPMIGPNLRLLFVGFNPGVESARQQHHYAHFSNLFWKLFNELGVLGRVLESQNIEIADHILLRSIYKNGIAGRSCAAASHDADLVQFGVGFTDIVLRCTRTAEELSLAEKLENVPRLLEEFSSSNATHVVFIGKGVWESFAKYFGIRVTKDSFVWGQQPEHVSSPVHKKCPHRPALHVFPSTSGLVALMKYEEKMALWSELASQIVDVERKDLEESAGEKRHAGLDIKAESGILDIKAEPGILEISESGQAECDTAVDTTIKNEHRDGLQEILEE